jgi:hypothetical protein
MKLRVLVVIILAALFCASAQGRTHGAQTHQTSDKFLDSFLQFDLDAAKKSANSALIHEPANAAALFVRMETAELEQQTDVVLESALRLCRSHSPAAFQEIASSRVLRYAANSSAFNAVLPQVKAAAQTANGCSLNLRLALVAAAADGDSAIALDPAAASAGLLTHWQVAGPFGRYNNVDPDRKWSPELDPQLQQAYGNLQTEEFWFRDGLVTLPNYLSATGVLYAGSEISSAVPEEFELNVLSPGPYSVFVDGKPALTHDSRYSLQAGIDSAAVDLGAGKHRVLVKFTADAAPLRVALSPAAKAIRARELPVPDKLQPYVRALQAYFREDLPELQRSFALNSGHTLGYLKALLYSSIEGRASDANAAWASLPPVPLATIRLAELAADGQEPDEFKQQITAMAQELPNSDAATGVRAIAD